MNSIYTIALFSICLVVASAAVSIIFSILFNGVAPMPTSQKAKRQMLEAIDDIKPCGNIFELGSGWGTLIFPLAKKFSDAQIYAFENSPVPYLFVKLIHRVFPYKNLEVHKKNFYTISLHEADVVVCYLYPKAMTNLKHKFENELKQDTLVISNTFAVPDWKPVRIIETYDIYRTKIYIYFFGAAVADKVDIIL